MSGTTTLQSPQRRHRYDVFLSLKRNGPRHFMPGPLLTGCLTPPEEGGDVYVVVGGLALGGGGRVGGGDDFGPALGRAGV